MELPVLLDRLSGSGFERLATASGRDATLEILDALPPSAPADWRQLAAALTVAGGEHRRIFGISGGQGAGKSTLAALLVAATEALGRRAISLSLDDFYLTHAERQTLARTVHPLLATRGVPGTHDVPLACATLDALMAGESCEVPVFDKSVDDRAPGGRRVEGPLDLVIFEGWCVGAAPEPESRLAAPVNDLEQTEDAEGVWRRYVNDALTKDYPRLWRLLDSLLYLKVPDMASVIRWRTEQEQAHPPERRMTEAAIARFVAHYERLTLWMHESLPGQADLVGWLDGEHRLVDLTGAAP